ncbi:hypothetical protein [Hymenobacter persicinus]|uniref:Uncharacterized protein n=1 Tax=Hymenobacter persicinus TaxID=2025506 RepID=A0A4Q5L6A1_9BACT|nr:hypothetical protein [Hymenobacter persicinus]RYU74642.1 hypothetical protein EWM57_20340 [Hymenobacter persicinus]
MLVTTLLVVGAQLLSGPVPTAPPASDTTRLVRGFMNQQFAWGTLVLRDGRRLQAYLPATTTGVDMMVPYYVLPPDAQPKSKPKLLAINKVKCMRVQGQYSELLTPDKNEMPRLAARRQAGAVELFLVQMTAPPLVATYLGSAPVLGAPATSAPGTAVASWYLRRGTGVPLLITPENFTSQVPAFLADDKELAAKVAAGAPGCRFADLEAIIQRYNQRPRR